MRKELLEISKKIENNYTNDFYQDRFDEMYFYVSKKMSSIFFRKNARELVKNIDILLKYTSFENLNWIDKIYDQPNFIDKIIENLRFFRYKYAIDELLQRIVDLLGNEIVFSDKMMDTIISLDLNSNILTNILDLMNDNQRIVFLTKCANNGKVPDKVRDSREEELEIIKSKISKFVNETDNLFALRNSIKSDSISLNKVNNYMDNHLDRVVDSIMNNLSFLRSKNSKVRDFIYYIIKDVVDNEHVKNSEIEIGGKGSFSEVIFIGNKVVKIGNKRLTNNFPNNPYIIKPLLRQEVEIDGDIFFIEVTEKVETFKNDKISEEILYDLYKKLRDLGLIWTDIASRNVGKLIKDNDIHWKEKIEPSDETLGLSKFRGTQKLKSGDYVLLDADCIFEENDPKIRYSTNTAEIGRKFEKRYREERGYSDNIEQYRDDNKTL